MAMRWILPVAVMLLGSVACAWAQPTELKGVVARTDGLQATLVEEGEHAGRERVRHRVILDNGLIRYGIDYNGYFDEREPQRAWPTSEGCVGMTLPTSANWYGGGFLAIRAFGTNVAETRPASLRVVETDHRGMAEMIWSLPEGQVRFRYLLEPKSDYLACEVLIHPLDDTPPGLSLFLHSFPSFFTSWLKRDGWRQAIGPNIIVEQGEAAEINPAENPWLLLQDTVFDVEENAAESAGPCGFLFVPDDMELFRVNVTNYPVSTTVRAKPELTRVRFAVWDFHKRTNADALKRMQNDAAGIIDHLRFLDFSDRVVSGFDVDRKREEMERMLAQSDDAEKHRTALTPLLDQVAQAMTEMAEGDMVREARAAELINEYENALWDLRFDALLSGD